jgi:S-DNA-T family DNA segregation ATPase FtsK/SpoIIIE
VGFVLLILASSAFESGHLLALPAQFPLTQGGMIGNALDSMLRSMFGFAGSTMCLIILIVYGQMYFQGIKEVAQPLSSEMGGLSNTLNNLVGKPPV